MSAHQTRRAPCSNCKFCWVLQNTEK